MQARTRANRKQGAAESSAYLRGSTRVPVRPGIWGWARRSLRWALIALCVAGLGLSATYSIGNYLRNDPRFVLPPDAAGLHVTGLTHLPPREVTKVFAGDLGHSIVAVPLEERRRELLDIPWVERATILRVWPNRLWVHIGERRPVAFVRVPRSKDGETAVARLVDRNGVFLHPPEGARLSLPVVSGISEAMPPQERRRRLALFERLMEALDSQEPQYGPMLSEIDISDPRNARVTTMYGDDVVDLELGDEEFRHRYELFLKYVDGWKREFGAVRAVDLRFEGQVAVR